MTFTSGTAISSSLFLTGNTIIGFQFITGWTSATLAFQSSTDGINFGPVYDDTGDELNITIPSYTQYMVSMLPPNMIATVGKLRWLKLVSGLSGSPVDQGSLTQVIPIYGSL